jgi:hypothetical protein
MARTSATTLLLAISLALVPRPASAQMSGGGPSRGWTPAQIGVRFGATSVSSNSVLGAQLWVPLIPAGYVQLIPNWDVTFLAAGFKEYQRGVQAVAVSGGRRGGLFAGGGLTWRNTIYDGPNRETKRWPDLVAGVRTGQISSIPLTAQLQIRWVFVDGPINPRILTFGVNVPLWGWERR